MLSLKKSPQVTLLKFDDSMNGKCNLLDGNMNLTVTKHINNQKDEKAKSLSMCTPLQVREKCIPVSKSGELVRVHFWTCFLA